MTISSPPRTSSDVVEVSTTRRGRRVRVALGVSLVVGTVGIVGAPSLVQASALPPKSFCAKIPATTVSSLFGGAVTLLGATSEGAGNDVCAFGKVVSGSFSGVTLNYDYMGTGTASSNLAALKKEKGVSDLVVKTYASIGGATYSFTDTYSDPTLRITIHESGMVSYKGANHYGLVVTKVLPTSMLAKLLTLAVKAA